MKSIYHKMDSRGRVRAHKKVRAKSSIYYRKEALPRHVVSTRYTNNRDANIPCPCGSRVKFKKCCGDWHTAHQKVKKRDKKGLLR